MTSSQDDTEDGYNLDGREILNFGKEIYILKRTVRANTSSTADTINTSQR